MRKSIQYFAAFAVSLSMVACASSTDSGELTDEPQPIDSVAHSDSTSDYSPSSDAAARSVSHSADANYGALDVCGRYMELYAQSKAKADLDSAVANFGRFAVYNNAAEPYLMMATSCEMLGQKKLAERYYREGRAANKKMIADPASANEGRIVFQLYDYYFAILLNEPVDMKKLEQIEKEITSVGGAMSNMLLPEGHSRKQLIEAFSM